MNYQALKENVFSEAEYSIVPLRKQDIFKIKDWRNAQTAVLRQQKQLTDDDQVRYYETAVLPTAGQKQPSLILFSFLKSGECIGYGGLTNINWIDKRIEMSFLVDPERTEKAGQYETEFSAFISLLKKAVFDDLNFNRMFTETYDIRPVHIETLEKNGFRPEGRMLQHVFIEGKFVDSLIHGFLREYYV